MRRASLAGAFVLLRAGADPSVAAPGGENALTLAWRSEALGDSPAIAALSGTLP